MAPQDRLQLLRVTVLLLAGFIATAMARQENVYDAQGRLLKTQTLAGEFDPKYSGGISGDIRAIFVRGRENPKEADIHVDLDMRDLDIDAVKRLYPKCIYPRAFKSLLWHLHVHWKHQETSGFLRQCSVDHTGGHYDATLACSPASQYANEKVCSAKKQSYACNPTTYAKTSIACEMGDLSGKFGRLRVQKDGLIKKKFKDYYFPPCALLNQPMPMVKTVIWNFVLHLNCPEHDNPPVLCARVGIEPE